MSWFDWTTYDEPVLLLQFPTCPFSGVYTPHSSFRFVHHPSPQVPFPSFTWMHVCLLTALLSIKYLLLIFLNTIKRVLVRRDSTVELCLICSIVCARHWDHACNASAYRSQRAQVKHTYLGQCCKSFSSYMTVLTALSVQFLILSGFWVQYIYFCSNTNCVMQRNVNCLVFATEWLVVAWYGIEIAWICWG